MRRGLGRACVAGLLVLACTPAQVRYERELERAPAAARHAVHSERLLELMRGLDRLSRERLPRALDVQEEQARRVQGIEQMAGALAASAREIPAAVQGVPLSEAERLAFATAAARLEGAAVQLGEAARRRSPEEIRAQARAIEAACSDCHIGFRATGPPADG